MHGSLRFFVRLHSCEFERAVSFSPPLSRFHGLADKNRGTSLKEKNAIIPVNLPVFLRFFGSGWLQIQPRRGNGVTICRHVICVAKESSCVSGIVSYFLS